MTQTLTVQELVIVIAAKNHNPTILTPDFLKYSGIVPTEWELARPPLYTNTMAQMTFNNGIGIVAEPNRVIFSEAIVGKAVSVVAVPGIARKYTDTLPNIDYQAIGLNWRGYVPFNEPQDAARKYLAETLLSAGPWHEFGTAPARASVNFAYTLERGQFNLSVNDALLNLADETTTPIVLFSGNFSYDIASKTVSERLLSLHQTLDNWQADLETYTDLVSNKFLVKVAEKRLNQIYSPRVLVPKPEDTKISNLPP